MTMLEGPSKAEALAVACAGAKLDDAYVFAPAVRIQCRADDGHDDPGQCGMEHYDDSWGLTETVNHCEGRKWNPSRDFLVWFREIREAQFWASCYHNEKGPEVTGHIWYKSNPGAHISREGDLMEAFLQSLHDALVGLGAEFPEALKFRMWW